MKVMSYRIMRLLVFFDLPMGTKKERKEYTNFRKKLLDDGFMMLQFSVYSRFCQNDSDVEKHIKRVTSFKPNNGNVRLLKITENQFNNMVVLVGEKNNRETDENEDCLLIFE